MKRSRRFAPEAKDFIPAASCELQAFLQTSETSLLLLLLVRARPEREFIPSLLSRRTAAVRADPRGRTGETVRRHGVPLSQTGLHLRANRPAASFHPASFAVCERPLAVSLGALQGVQSIFLG
ncbi:hypothetical protein FQA47_016483 [Oryzias melastigma]|uniref:Uncharacterized protein n=1 Tax=Oryzias melastigma TaxID=30732 RepID=A0A834CAF8_ORYME|nr:hypothetical protein FQA47_016483 [Oryzias melastigma]